MQLRIDSMLQRTETYYRNGRKSPLLRTKYQIMKPVLSNEMKVVFCLQKHNLNWCMGKGKHVQLHYEVGYRGAGAIGLWRLWYSTEALVTKATEMGYWFTTFNFFVFLKCSPKNL